MIDSNTTRSAAWTSTSGSAGTAACGGFAGVKDSPTPAGAGLRVGRRTLLGAALAVGGSCLTASVLGPVAALAPGRAHAQAPTRSTWPAKPIRFVVPFPPGGSSDSLGRVLAEGLREVLGQTVVIENKPGGTTQVGTEIVSHADPDGYTLLQGSATAFSVLPNLRKIPYDPDKDFEVAGGVADYVAIVTVRKDLGVKTLRELIAMAKKDPGKLTYGSAGLASVGHISGEILKRAAGIDMLHVPFKGSGQLVTSLVGGEIDVILDGVGLGLAKSGRAVPLAAFSEKRHPELPEVPALAEAGVEIELPAGGWGVMAPRGTPEPVMRTLSAALEKVVTSQAAIDAMLRFGVVARWTPPKVYRQGLVDARKFYATLLPAIGLSEPK